MRVIPYERVDLFAIKGTKVKVIPSYTVVSFVTAFPALFSGVVFDISFSN